MTSEAGAAVGVAVVDGQIAHHAATVQARAGSIPLVALVYLRDVDRVAAMLGGIDMRRQRGERASQEVLMAGARPLLARRARADAPVHLLQGVPHDMVAEIAEGLNRSKQVQDPSLENLRGHFDEIKKVMTGHVGHDAIAYHEGAEGDVYIAEILALIEMFNFERYPKDEHPYGLYAHQSRAVKEFAEDFEANPSSSSTCRKF